MSIPFNPECLLCHMTKALNTARSLGTEEQAMVYARRLMELYLSAPADVGSPWFSPGASELLQELYDLPLDRFREEKLQSNRFVMERLDQIQGKVNAHPDPVLAGLKFAILGNYIDFSALHGEVSFEKLDQMLQSALEMELPEDTYAAFLSDLQKGSKLLYLTDNAGEIGFDRVFAEAIHQAYPQIQITFCVRGGPANNDATREDAQAVGIPFPVIDNGNRVPGTQLDQLSPEAKQAMEEADLIIAKGQGNVETMLGCGYNVYYAFLVKCARFINHFQKPKLTPMLLRER